MSRYNTWRNASLATVADGLSDEERRKDRSAFFKSIAATLNHLSICSITISQSSRAANGCKFSLCDKPKLDHLPL
ncbi:DinB family protein [Ochrobactrum vermis]|uniref:DinB family protein n=1 Tax=Ochrobactrum vermis TaxID=1827297 RepID=A0ABU8PEI3_9HYPH|nr:DinB family protein [Ochrobactrum vermis]